MKHPVTSLVQKTTSKRRRPSTVGSSCWANDSVSATSLVTSEPPCFQLPRYGIQGPVRIRNSHMLISGVVPWTENDNAEALE